MEERVRKAAKAKADMEVLQPSHIKVRVQKGLRGWGADGPGSTAHYFYLFACVNEEACKQVKGLVEWAPRSGDGDR